MPTTYFSRTGEDISSRVSVKTHFDNSIKALVVNTFSEDREAHTCTTPLTLRGKTCFFSHSADSEHGWTLSTLQTLVSHEGSLPRWTQFCTKYNSGNCCCNSPPALCSKTDGSNVTLPPFCQGPWLTYLLPHPMDTGDLWPSCRSPQPPRCCRPQPAASSPEFGREKYLLFLAKVKWFSCVCVRTFNLRCVCCRLHFFSCSCTWFYMWNI